MNHYNTIDHCTLSIASKRHVGRVPLLLAAVLLTTGCLATENADTWQGDELWELETVPDKAPRYAEGGDSDDVTKSSWTQWYDRDNPSGTGDWETRDLQSGVCDTPSAVECQTVTGLYLWQTGDNVQCDTDGLLCLNDAQSDGACDHDYKVRFLCCEPDFCGPGDCGVIDDGCGGTIDCGACPVCGDGVCGSGEPLTCPSDCTVCGDGVCSPGESSLTCPADCAPPASCVQSVSLNCGSSGGNEYSCLASASGSCSSYTYSWTYQGQGDLYEYGNHAEVMQPNTCDPNYFNVITVRATGNDGSQASTFEVLPCLNVSQ